MEDTPQADHIRFLFDPRATLTAVARQRRRLASTVETLSIEELAHPSRCEGWSTADVLRHLVWVDLTVRGIWAGDVSVAAGFDPRITPNEAIQSERALPDGEIRERYLVSTETMVKDLESSDRERFGRPSLSPAGRVPWWMSAVHIGWDSSIHERDALLPLDRTVERTDSETCPFLAYSLILTSFFAGRGPLSVRLGTIDLSRDTGPVVVRVGTDAHEPSLASPDPPIMVTTHDPVEAIDAIAGRGPIEEALIGDAAVIHRLGGLARYFASA